MYGTCTHPPKAHKIGANSPHFQIDLPLQEPKNYRQPNKQSVPRTIQERSVKSQPPRRLHGEDEQLGQPPLSCARPRRRRGGSDAYRCYSGRKIPARIWSRNCCCYWNRALETVRGIIWMLCSCSWPHNHNLAYLFHFSFKSMEQLSENNASKIRFGALNGMSIVSTTVMLHFLPVYICELLN